MNVKRAGKNLRGFTLVELLVVMVVIGILAGITVTYYAIQQRARETLYLGELKKLGDALDIYYTKNGNYPPTTNNPKSAWPAQTVRTDDNCITGSAQADWIPSINEQLPQSIPGVKAGVGGVSGCYIYVSNGQEFVLSAWNMLSQPATGDGYRRLGFRKFTDENSTQFYTCNDNSTGGGQGNNYDEDKDYYKYSYTISNITDCDESPPDGA